VYVGALRGAFGFGSWVRRALVKWNVMQLIYILQKKLTNESWVNEDSNV